jgi:hypothetical protein
VLGEHFTTRVVNDPQQGGLPVGVVAVPESWTFDAQVTWNYANYSNPVSASSLAQNPKNAEAVIGYPAAQFFDLRPRYPGIFQFGQNVGGYIYAVPQSPVATLGGFVQQVRGRQPGFQFVGSKELPDLPHALRLPASGNQHGIGIKVTYDLSGTVIEEEFYAVHYMLEIPYDGPQGRTYQINWGLLNIHSFRAPRGTLDPRRAVFAAVAKSFRPNPAWQQRLAAINAYLQDQFNRQIQAGYDQIAAAARLSQQISANNDAMIAAIDRQLAASSSSGTGSSSGRSSVEKFDDYIRGVETVDDPYYGTSQQSADYQYHWTDGYGGYRNTNDPSYRPGQTESGDWTLMTPTR